MNIKLRAPRVSLPRKRDFARMINLENKSIREPINLPLRKQVLKKANNKCEICKNIKNSEVPLQIHHKNMINEDNNLSNLLALCPNCHSKIHKNYKLVHKRDAVGRIISSKVVKKKAKKKTTKNKKKSSQNPLEIKMPKLDLGI